MKSNETPLVSRQQPVKWEVNLNLGHHREASTYSIIHYDTAQSNDKTTLKTKTYKKIFVKNEMSITELEYTCSAQDLSG